MAHRIEAAPSGRATCRGCKQPIGKGCLRFAEEFQNPYSEEGGASFRYWHLPCAATKLANELAAALATFEGDVEDRGALEQTLQQHLRPEMPFAERAPNGRARCRACDTALKKGELRLAFERMFESPMGPQKAAAYAHPGCLGAYLDRERERGRAAPERAEAERLVLEHSRLSADDVASLKAELGARAPAS
jgi:poly(ADP-ribose) polymerase-like protein